MDYRAHFYASACGRLELFARDYPASTPDAPTLLLMHGLTRNSADFEPLVEHLAGRYRLLVPDQRGRGRSERDPEPANYRPDVYAGDMFALLDDLAVTRAALIGTSMGGLMAMGMAAARPARVPAIVLNDIGPDLAPAGLARIAGYVGGGDGFAGWQQAAEACRAIHHQAYPDFGAEQWDAFARRTCAPRPDGSLAFAYDPAIAEGIAQADGVAPPDLWPLWQALAQMPVLVIRGALSDLLAPATVQRMAQHHPGPFTALEVPGRGHAPLLDEPVALAAIETFLARHAA